MEVIEAVLARHGPLHSALTELNSSYVCLPIDVL
jgi:hypothetical protein